MRNHKNRSDDAKSNSDLSTDVSRRKALGFLAAMGVGVPGLVSCADSTLDVDDGASHDVPPAAIDMGMIIARGAKNYESWRGQLSWHTYVSERRPALFVRPETTEQIVAAVRFAAANGLKISTKSGGHNYYESWMREDSLVLDMYNFRHVEVDPEGKTAWVDPSVWSFNLLTALKPYELAFPVATCASVGMGGYVMGGGIGYGWQDWGLACDNVLAAEVITASGDVILATPESHSDLYWAARGGVAGFPGVVRRWKLQCHDEPKKIRVTAKMFPASMMPDVIDASQAEADKQIPGLHIHVVVVPTMMAKAVFLPPDVAADLTIDDKYVCMAEMYVLADTETELDRITDDRFTAPIFSEALATSVHAGNNGLLSVYQELKGREITVTNQICSAVWTPRMKESMDAIMSILENSSADLAYAAMLLNGKNMHDEAGAYSMAGQGSGSLSVYGVWFSDNEGDVARWADAISERLDPFAEGRYINETDCFRRPDHVAKAYSAEKWVKLKQVNKTYDPAGLFHTFPGFEASS